MNMTKMPNLFMLVGMPASGKSTWAKDAVQNGSDIVILSTDNYIEVEAANLGKTYNDIFEEYIGYANNILSIALQKALRERKNVIWDQTNLSASSRKKKLAQIPDDYHKVAVVFEYDKYFPELWKERLGSRPGKSIPQDVLDKMQKSFEFPTVSEGFDEIWEV